MRADRRHELKENDLQHAIETGRAYLQKHGKGVGLTVLGVAAVVVVVSFAVRSYEATAEDHWQRKSLLSFEPENAKQALDSLANMAEESNDQSFVLSALIQQGTEALRLAVEADAAPDPEFNETARTAFETLLERFPNNPLAFGIAHRGLATVEGNAFSLDGDPSHKTRADEHFKAIMDNTALHATPLYRMARDRRETLDEAFTKVVFAPPLPPEQTPEGEAPALTPGVPVDMTGRLKRVDPPEWAKDLPALSPTAPPQPIEADKQGETAPTGDPTETSGSGDAPAAGQESPESPPDDPGATGSDPE